MEIPLWKRESRMCQYVTVFKAAAEEAVTWWLCSNLLYICAGLFGILFWFFFFTFCPYRNSRTESILQKSLRFHQG